jgi:hypothetical protein
MTTPTNSEKRSGVQKHTMNTIQDHPNNYSQLAPKKLPGRLPRYTICCAMSGTRDVVPHGEDGECA